MIRAVYDSWAARTARERRLLGALGGLLLAALIVYGIVRPLADMRSQAEARLDAAIDRHLLVLNAAASARPAGAEALDSRTLIALAEAQGLDADVAGGSASRIEITIAAARPDRLFGFLGMLEAERGARVVDARITRNEPASLSIRMTVAP